MILPLSRHLWQSYWHLVCHRAELPLPGDYLRLQVLDAEIVVFNDHGDLVAFDNRCPHRGARIFLGEHGNGPATCGYHGWTYNAGRMIIPCAAQIEGLETSSVDLTRWQTAWVGDFLFVGHSPLTDVEDQLGETRSLLEDISFGVDRRIDINTYDFETDWTIAIENALEPYHVSLIHPESLGLLDLQDGENHFHGENSVWYAPVGNARMAKQLGALKRFFQLDYQYPGYMSLYLFPFTMLSSTFGYSYSVQSFFPSSHIGRTHFSSRLLAMATKPGVDRQVLDGFFSSSAQVNRRVFDEDHAICKRVPTDTWTADQPRFAAQNEAKLLHFRKSCRAHLAGLRPPLRPSS